MFDRSHDSDKEIEEFFTIKDETNVATSTSSSHDIEFDTVFGTEPTNGLRGTITTPEIKITTTAADNYDGDHSKNSFVADNIVAMTKSTTEQYLLTERKVTTTSYSALEDKSVTGPRDESLTTTTSANYYPTTITTAKSMLIARKRKNGV